MNSERIIEVNFDRIFLDYTNRDIFSFNSNFLR